MASARSRPCAFTTIPIISGASPEGVFIALRRSITASLSAICGTCFGETKLTASMWRKPSEISRLRYCTFSSVGITWRNPCQASRGHFTMVTSSLISLEPGAPVYMDGVPLQKDCGEHRNCHQADGDARNLSLAHFQDDEGGGHDDSDASHILRNLKHEPQSRTARPAALRDR